MLAFNGHKIYVRSFDGQNEEWLTCLNEDTFQIDKQVSSTFQLSFTAFLTNKNGVSFDLLKNDAYIIFDGQKYQIKQCVSKYVDDFVTKDVTATHEIFGIQNFRQFKVNKGSQSYSIDSMLKFVFDSQYNSDYSYQINGSFPNVDITDWGNCSGLDAIQKAVDSYGARWLPNGKTVLIYDQNSYKNVTNRQFIWSHNTNDIELSVDSTSMVNGAMLYGATVDDSHSSTADGTSTSDSTGSSSTLAATSTGNSIGTISTMEDGGAPVYSSPVGNNLTGQKLPNGSKWAIDKQVSINGVVWYRVATNEWVSEKYFSFDKSGDVKPEQQVIEQVWGQGTIKAADITTGTGDNQTTTTPTFAKIYDSPFSGQHEISGRTLPNGSQWKIDGTVSDGYGGKTWYRVATNEWVCADDINFDGDTDVEPKSTDAATDDTAKADTDEVKYYFDPFFYYSLASRSEHGLIIGEDITNDQIKDVDSMKKYADSVMQTEPVVELTVNLSAQDDSLNIGDTLFLNAEPLGIKTMITLNGISGNPLTNNSPMTVTLDNSKLSKRDINYEMSDKIRLANRNNVLLNKAFKKQEAKLSQVTNSIKSMDNKINKINKEGS
ncbi:MULTISPECIES: prophage endopeptidase tail family protein [Companilactobacillus]|uniref:prophage endopeptidase tail family protein n=1 Tax=Companilactobacillus TaxID=2767879 RepID=UPI002FF392C5